MATESLKARRARVSRQKAVETPSRRWATAQSLREIQGPLVTAMQLPWCGEWFLFKRLDLAGAIKNRLWPEPITMAVRRLMTTQPREWQAEDENVVENLEMACAVARATIVIPPAELMDGTITEAEVTEDMLRPMFVTGDPEDGQALLLGPGDPEPKSVAFVRLQPNDLSWIAVKTLTTQLGAMSSFRADAGVAVEGVDAPEDDGAVDG